MFNLWCTVFCCCYSIFFFEEEKKLGHPRWQTAKYIIRLHRITAPGKKSETHEEQSSAMKMDAMK